MRLVTGSRCIGDVWGNGGRVRMRPAIPVARHRVVHLPPVLTDMRGTILLHVVVAFQNVVRLQCEVRIAEDELAKVDEAMAEVRELQIAVIPSGKCVAHESKAVELVVHRDGEGSTLGAEAHEAEAFWGVRRPFLPCVQADDWVMC